MTELHHKIISCYSCDTEFKFCPCCGKPLVVTLRVANRPYGENEYVRGEDFKALLQPLIDLDGPGRLAMQLGVNPSRLRAIVKQERVNLSTVDRWLTQLGLTHALSDGTLRVLKRYVEPPPTIYYEE